MMLFRRLFRRIKEPAAEEARGYSTQQTQAEEDATRERMEAEVAADRERRGATDVRPGGEQPAKEDSARPPTGDT